MSAKFRFPGFAKWALLLTLGTAVCGLAGCPDPKPKRPATFDAFDDNVDESKPADIEKGVVVGKDSSDGGAHDSDGGGTSSENAGDGDGGPADTDAGEHE